jgi:hypothetical protein
MWVARSPIGIRGRFWLQFELTSLFETAAVAGVVRMLTPEYLAAQLAGSSRLEGIRVSAADEKEMASIIRGDVSEASLIRSLKSKYRTKARTGIKIVL